MRTPDTAIPAMIGTNNIESCMIESQNDIVLEKAEKVAIAKITTIEPVRISPNRRMIIFATDEIDIFLISTIMLPTPIVH